MYIVYWPQWWLMGFCYFELFFGVHIGLACFCLVYRQGLLKEMWCIFVIFLSIRRRSTCLRMLELRDGSRVWKFGGYLAWWPKIFEAEIFWFLPKHCTCNIPFNLLSNRGGRLVLTNKRGGFACDWYALLHRNILHRSLVSHAPQANFRSVSWFRAFAT